MTPKIRNLLVLLALVASVVIVILVTALRLPYQGERPETVEFEIEEGDSLTRIAKKLEDEQIVGSKLAFKYFSILYGKKTSYKSGNYLIRGKVSIRQLIDVFDEGKVKLVKVTVPEGYSAKEIEQLFHSKDLKNEGKYLELAFDQEFIESLGLPFETESLEGFLFPDTYKFTPGSSEKTILRAMVKNFLRRVPADYAKKAEKVGLTYYEAVNLASMIEKETSAIEERRLISSVFHNRLKKKMKLQSDPTVIYGIKNYDGNITRKQLRTKTPFNTYAIEGLPKTPIANPGLDSLLAAVDPAESKYLFFVGMGNGRHKFSVNYKEHSKAVAKYQLKRVKNYRSY